MLKAIRISAASDSTEALESSGKSLLAALVATLPDPEETELDLSGVMCCCSFRCWEWVGEARDGEEAGLAFDITDLMTESIVSVTFLSSRRELPGDCLTDVLEGEVGGREKEGSEVWGGETTSRDSQVAPSSSESESSSDSTNSRDEYSFSFFWLRDALDSFLLLDCLRPSRVFSFFCVLGGESTAREAAAITSSIVESRRSSISGGRGAPSEAGRLGEAVGVPAIKPDTLIDREIGPLDDFLAGLLP